MNHTHMFFAMLILLILTACCQEDICVQVFGDDVQNECMFGDMVSWDSVLLVSPHTYPDEVEKYTSIKYDFPLRADPYFTFIFMRDGEIYKRDCGACRNLNISSSFKVADGIMVIRRTDCIKQMRNDQGVLFLKME